MVIKSLLWIVLVQNLNVSMSVLILKFRNVIVLLCNSILSAFVHLGWMIFDLLKEEHNKWRRQILQDLDLYCIFSKILCVWAFSRFYWNKAKCKGCLSMYGIFNPFGQRSLFQNSVRNTYDLVNAFAYGSVPNIHFPHTLAIMFVQITWSAFGFV